MTKPSGYWRSARSPDERSDIRGFLVHPRLSLCSCGLLATCIADNSFRICGARRPLKRHPQGRAAIRQQDLVFLKLRLHPIVARAALHARSNGVVYVEKLDFADPDPVPRFDWSPAGRIRSIHPASCISMGSRAAARARPIWTASDRALSARRREERETSVAVPAEPEIERIDAGPPACGKTCRTGCPHLAARRHDGVERQNARNTKASNSKKIAAPNAAPQAPAKEMPSATAAVTPQKAVGETAAAIQKPEPKVESADPPEPQTAAIAAPQPAEAPRPRRRHPRSSPRRSLRLPCRRRRRSILPPRPPRPLPLWRPSKAREIGKAASASPDDPDNLVALVLARPEINSLSDLNNKNIAITEKQSASSGRVSAALMAAGAAEVQFSEVKASAIDRLISGEVPAAVVLASREVASLFPEIEGFRTFRVPLSMKARL